MGQVDAIAVLWATHSTACSGDGAAMNEITD